jgi:thioredoxin-dependent peroxiredoxin
MKLAPGDRAVEFSTLDADGHPVSLGAFRGSPVLLMFFRFASCPMCNLRLHDFAKEYPRLHANGLSALAFFHSSAGAIRRHAGRRSYPFPLVPDQDQKIYRDFGVTTSWAGLFGSMALPSFYWDWMRSMRHGFWGGVDLHMAKMPADFLVGADGRLLLAHYGRTIGDHLSLAAIESTLAERSATNAAVASA